jgi:hypothetical protein
VSSSSNASVPSAVPLIMWLSSCTSVLAKFASEESWSRRMTIRRCVSSQTPSTGSPVGLSRMVSETATVTLRCARPTPARAQISAVRL